MKRSHFEANAEAAQPNVDMGAVSSEEIVNQPVSPTLPSVSVIVALYNAAPYLDECLDSILAQVEILRTLSNHILGVSKKILIDVYPF